MYRFIQRADIVEVLAVVWCVTPQVRTNSSLRTQAEFINRLKDGDIWSNVIIIVKQSVNPKYDARGALAAMQVQLTQTYIKSLQLRNYNYNSLHINLYLNRITLTPPKSQYSATDLLVTGPSLRSRGR